MRVLLVEDQAALRGAVTQVLEHHGHQVFQAEHATQALDIFHAEHPDLLLLDVVLPDQDGYWLARQIREAEGAQWTPIIFLSSMDHDVDLWQGIEAGGDDYLIKPVSEMVLRSKLLAMQRLLDMRRQLISVAEELRRANEHLRHQSAHDDLTGLANRRSFNAELHAQIAAARRSGEPLTLILCDVDHFKRYNDSQGHLEGDRCLQHIASLLKSVCRRPCDQAARYGGEEFGLILPNTPKSGAMTFARALQQMLNQQALPHPDSPLGSLVTISGGITTCVPDAETTAQSLLMRADEALYRAKSNGRNRFFSLEMQLDSLQSAPGMATI
ncbi:diguanylate cyclase [Aquabacterium sp. A3]|uniref:GGDEF domain-containing response regulator n=1 Tax=Aquabacterium sp. A3 TaxID=3132829 RepID=UPI00311A069F